MGSGGLRTSGSMRDRRRRWLTAGLLIVGADAGLLLSAGLVLGASQQVHASAFGLVSLMMDEMGSLVPAGVSAGLAAILGLLGAGWWQQHLIGPALTSESDAGLPALGGVLAAPVYLVVRRAARTPRKESPDAAGSPPHRVYVARMTKALEPLDRASTGV